MVVRIKMSKEEKRLAKAYAKLNGVSLSMAMKNTYFQKIEDEYDIVLIDSALRDYEMDHKSYSHEEIKRMFEL